MKKSLLCLLLMSAFPILGNQIDLPQSSFVGTSIKKAAEYTPPVSLLTNSPSDANRPAEFDYVQKRESQEKTVGSITYSIDYTYVGYGHKYGSTITVKYLESDTFWKEKASYTISIRNKTAFDSMNSNYISILSTSTNENLTKITFRLNKLPVNQTPLFTLNTVNGKIINNATEYEQLVRDTNDKIANGNSRIMTRTIHTFQRDEAYTLNDGGTATVFVDVDDELEIAEIMKMVSAQDLFGQNVPVVVGENDYNQTKVGTYVIPISATDSQGQIARATITVVVRDYVPPQITTKSVEITCVDTITFDTFKTRLTATDNYYPAEDIKFECVSISEGFEWNKQNPVGTYVVQVKATDPSGASSTTGVTIIVTDKIPPIIKDLTGNVPSKPIEVGVSALAQDIEAQVLSFFVVEDNCDNDLKPVIKEGKIEAKVGTYTLVLSATDSSGNTVEQSVQFKVLADSLPVFLLNPLFAMSTVDKPLSAEDVNSIILKAIPVDARELRINESDVSNYLDNNRIEGEKRIRFSYIDKDNNIVNSELVINVMGKVTSNPTFFSSLLTSWKTLFNNISSMNVYNWMYILLTLVLVATVVGLLYLGLKYIKQKHNKVEEITKTDESINSDIIEDEEDNSSTK